MLDQDKVVTVGPQILTENAQTNTLMYMIELCNSIQIKVEYKNLLSENFVSDTLMLSNTGKYKNLQIDVLFLLDREKFPSVTTKKLN